jgi:hypothetical protein
MKQEFKLRLLGELSTDWDVAQWEENGPKGLWVYWKSRSETYSQSGLELSFGLGAV